MLFAILLMSSLQHPFSDQWNEESIWKTQGWIGSADSVGAESKGYKETRDITLLLYEKALNTELIISL